MLYRTAMTNLSGVIAAVKGKTQGRFGQRKALGLVMWDPLSDCFRNLADGDETEVRQGSRNINSESVLRQGKAKSQGSEDRNRVM